MERPDSGPGLWHRTQVWLRVQLLLFSPNPEDDCFLCEFLQPAAGPPGMNKAQSLLVLDGLTSLWLEVLQRLQLSFLSENLVQTLTEIRGRDTVA